MNVLLFLVLVTLVLNLFLSWRMANELQFIRKHLADVQGTLFASGNRRVRLPNMRGSWGHPHGSAHVGLGFFSIWEWQGGKWQLKSAVVPPGVDAGTPPTHSGAFEGDHVKKWVPHS